VFSDIGAIQSLKRLVSYSTNGTTSALAKRALRLLGEEVPRRIQPSVASWKEAEVQTWLQQIGFSQYCERFRVEPWGAASPGVTVAPRGLNACGAAVSFWGWEAYSQSPLGFHWPSPPPVASPDTLSLEEESLPHT
jgi:hypothetical protein